MGSMEIRVSANGYNTWGNGKLDAVQLGKQIKKYRLEKGLRQRDLAKLVFSTTNTISRLEIGNIGCSLEMLLAIANALELSPDALLFGNFNPMYSRFYPYFWELKDSIFGMLQKSVEDIFRDMDKKERIFSVEKDFHEWIENFAAETLGEKKKVFYGSQKGAEKEKNAKEHAFPWNSFPGKEEPEGKREAEKSLELQAAIGGGKKKSTWLLEEFNKEKLRKKEEEEAVRKSHFLEEVRIEEEKIHKMEEVLREARDRLEEKKRRDVSFIYAAESFLFPKNDIAEEEQSSKKEKIRQRVRLKRGEGQQP